MKKKQYLLLDASQILFLLLIIGIAIMAILDRQGAAPAGNPVPTNKTADANLPVSLIDH